MCIRMITLVSAASMVLALAGCEDSNTPLADEQEYQLTIHPNGVATERQRLWGVGARSDDTNTMQRVVEKLVEEYEPFIYQRTPHARETNVFVLRREIIIRGDVLDCYRELEYPEGIWQTVFKHLQTNGVFAVPLDETEVDIRHNGERQMWRDGTNVIAVAVWRTNTALIWFKQTLRNRTSDPCAWAYKAYLDHNRVFPWRGDAVRNAAARVGR